MNSLTINKKTQIAKKFGIYFYQENNIWYFYDKKTYQATKKQYNEISLYCTENLHIDKKELGNHLPYHNFNQCFQAALDFYNQKDNFVHFLKTQKNIQLFNYLQELIPLKDYKEKKIKI